MTASTRPHGQDHRLTYDVYGIGNALVDMEYRVDESFLRHHGIAKGHTTLVDEQRVQLLAEDLKGLRPERMSGGSAANTLMAIQGFGGQAFYSCKVAQDDMGEHFLHDLSEAGIHVNANAAAADGHSGQCLVLITADAERSMNSFLGASTQLSPADLDADALAKARTLYIEGYLSASPHNLAAAEAARGLAEQYGRSTSLSLSDPAMVVHFRAQLKRMLGNGVRWLFCNEEEALTWAGTDRLDVAIAELKDIGQVCFITLGRQGSLSIVQGKAKQAPGFAVSAVDTTGAGDIYAGACLYGLGAGMEASQAALFGNYAASVLVQQYGARLRTLKQYQRVLTNFKRR